VLKKLPPAERRPPTTDHRQNIRHTPNTKRYIKIHKMDVSNAVRQVEELLTQQETWYGCDGAIKIKTPALFSRLQRIGQPSSNSSNSNNSNYSNYSNYRLLEVKKTLAFDIKCSILHPNELSNLIISIEFPLDYPSSSTCRVKAVHSSHPDREYTSCTSAIAKYLEAFTGCECVELVIEWLAEHKMTCLEESQCSDDVADGSGVVLGQGKVQCYVLRFNHILSGPEHKKEKAMLDVAKKMKLQGGLLWGTPGIVVVVPPSTEEEAKDYASECRTIGKRADGVEEMWLPQSGIDEAGLGGLAQQKRGGKFQDLDTAALRLGCGGDEDLLRFVLGIQ
jgi:hypothetical protein